MSNHQTGAGVCRAALSTTAKLMAQNNAKTPDNKQDPYEKHV
jgi:hypothetical protein